MEYFDVIVDMIIQGALWLIQFVDPIAMAMIATALVVFGSEVIQLVFNPIRHWPVFVRYVLFVLFSLFGFSALMTFAVPLVADVLIMIDPIWLPFVLILIFGFLSHRARKKGWF
jgi:hypothetical protein